MSEMEPGHVDSGRAPQGPWFFFSKKWGDFLGGPLAKTLHSQCRGPVFDLWSGN